MEGNTGSNLLLCEGNRTMSTTTTQLALEGTDPNGKLKCPECDATFAKPNKLKRHLQNVHQDVRPFRCELCGSDYKRREHLTRHQVSVHAGDQERQLLKCPYAESHGCLQTFPNRDQQRKHVQRTHERRLTCDQCAWPEPVHFQKKSQLRKHMSEVHGEGYACGHCGKHFGQRKHLNSHIARVRKTQAKKSKQIYFEHEMTLPQECGDDEGQDKVLGEIVSSSSSSDSSDCDDEESKGHGLFVEDADESWKVELLQYAQKRMKVEQNAEIKMPHLEQPEDLAELCLRPTGGSKLRGRGQSISSRGCGMNHQSRSSSLGNRSGQGSENLYGIQNTYSSFDQSSNLAKRYLLQCNTCGMFQGLRQRSSDFMKHITRCWNRKNKGVQEEAEEQQE